LTRSQLSLFVVPGADKTPCPARDPPEAGRPRPYANAAPLPSPIRCKTAACSPAALTATADGELGPLVVTARPLFPGSGGTSTRIAVPVGARRAECETTSTRARCPTRRRRVCPTPRMTTPGHTTTSIPAAGRTGRIPRHCPPIIRRRWTASARRRRNSGQGSLWITACPRKSRTSSRRTR
jgi:hypothetical protein